MHFPHNVSLVRIGVCVCVCVWLGKGQMYLSAVVWEESLKKEQAKCKELENKFKEKIAQHGVR